MVVIRRILRFSRRCTDSIYQPVRVHDHAGTTYSGDADISLRTYRADPLVRNDVAKCKSKNECVLNNLRTRALNITSSFN